MSKDNMYFAIKFGVDGINQRIQKGNAAIRDNLVESQDYRNYKSNLEWFRELLLELDKLDFEDTHLTNLIKYTSDIENTDIDELVRCTGYTDGFLLYGKTEEEKQKTIEEVDALIKEGLSDGS